MNQLISRSDTLFVVDTSLHDTMKSHLPFEPYSERHHRIFIQRLCVKAAVDTKRII